MWLNGIQAIQWCFIELVSHFLVREDGVSEVCSVLECVWFNDLVGRSSCSAVGWILSDVVLGKSFLLRGVRYLLRVVTG